MRLPLGMPHMMQQFYHDADPFRWHLNVFLKAIKEVPQILQIGLQNANGFPSWFKLHRQALIDDELFGGLSKKQDIVVHKGMLIPVSLEFAFRPPWGAGPNHCSEMPSAHRRVAHA